MFTNEINDALGLPRSSEGQVTGYLRGHRRVTFYDDLTEEEIREILSTRRNEDIRVPIRLRPSGIIYHLIDKERWPSVDKLDPVDRRRLLYYE